MALVSKTKVYCECYSLTLYDTYLRSDTGLDSLVDSVVPLIVDSVQGKFRGGAGETSDYELSALEHVYNLLQNKSAPNQVRSFTAFVATCSRRAAMRAYHSASPQVFDYEYQCMDQPVSKIRDQRDLDYVIYYRQIMNQVYKHAAASVRFSGGERQVCLKILRDLMEGSPDVSTNFLALRFGVDTKRARWLSEYARVMYRLAHYRISGAIPESQ